MTWCVVLMLVLFALVLVVALCKQGYISELQSASDYEFMKNSKPENES